MKKILWFIVVAAVMTGCTTTKYVTVPEIHTDTVYQTKVAKDSVVVRDSIYIREYTQGDTVHVEKLMWRDRWRDRLLTDTVYKSRTDTITKPVPVEVEVEKPLPWWKKTLMWIGIIVLISFLLVVAIMIRDIFKP